MGLEQRWIWKHIPPCSNLIRPWCAERAKPGHHVIFHALVALKMLVSLISCLVARIVVDKQTDTQTNYCNPHCACAPRVNNENCGRADVRSHARRPVHIHVVTPSSITRTTRAYAQVDRACAAHQRWTIDGAWLMS